MVRGLVRLLDWLDHHNLAPWALQKDDPNWCTVFLTNVGSFGLDAPFHHLYERGTCSMFVAVGRVRELSELAADGSTLTRKKLLVRYSFDDRIADGVYMGKSLKLFQQLIEQPQPLTVRPERPEQGRSPCERPPWYRRERGSRPNP